MWCEEDFNEKIAQYALLVVANAITSAAMGIAIQTPGFYDWKFQDTPHTLVTVSTCLYLQREMSKEPQHPFGCQYVCPTFWVTHEILGDPEMMQLYAWRQRLQPIFSAPLDRSLAKNWGQDIAFYDNVTWTPNLANHAMLPGCQMMPRPWQDRWHQDWPMTWDKRCLQRLGNAADVASKAWTNMILNEIKERQKPNKTRNGPNARNRSAENHGEFRRWTLLVPTPAMLPSFFCVINEVAIIMNTFVANIAWDPSIP